MIRTYMCVYEGGGRRGKEGGREGKRGREGENE